MISDKDFMNADKLEQKNKQFYKTLKSTKSCDRFCKSSALNIEKFSKKAAKSHGYTYKKPSKTLNDSYYRDCRKSFCNESCKGYMFNDKKREQKFNSEIKNGFQKKYTKKNIKMLKKKGAVSGCLYNEMIL